MRGIAFCRTVCLAVMVAGIIVYSTTCPLTVNAATVFAEVPIGHIFLSKEAVKPFTSLTIFSSAENTTGIHLRIVVIACGAFDELDAISGDVSEPISICSPVSTEAVGNEQIYGIFLPQGYGLKFTTGESVSGTGLSSIFISYDFGG